MGDVTLYVVDVFYYWVNGSRVNGGCREAGLETYGTGGRQRVRERRGRKKVH